MVLHVERLRGLSEIRSSYATLALAVRTRQATNLHQSLIAASQVLGLRGCAMLPHPTQSTAWGLADEKRRRARIKKVFLLFLEVAKVTSAHTAVARSREFSSSVEF